MSPKPCRLCNPSSSWASSRRLLLNPRILRRPYSSAWAISVAAQFLSSSQTRPPRARTQLLDGNQLQRLSATLSRSELANSLPDNGTPLPAGYHLAYFTPAQMEAHLGRDGTDTTFNPPRPFTRRMWAGGELEWTGGDINRLKVGQKVTEVTKLVSSVGKKTRGGEEMIVVGVEKTYENKHGIALIDKRNWIFRPEILRPQTPASKPEAAPLPEGKHVRDCVQTPVTLFRFSALTFNGHKIHYSKEWCQDVEGHRGLVVHGPLNLINMLNLWRDVRGGDSTPKRITYRATSPLYAEEPYRIVMGDEVDRITDVKVVAYHGGLCMVGQIESF